MSDARLLVVALRFLRWFCPDHLIEEIEGDLLQKFRKDVRTFGELQAKKRLIWNVVRFFRPGILLRNKASFNVDQIIMFRNYFKTSIRHLRNHKAYTTINLIGLAMGMCVCFFALEYIGFELSYDRYNAKADRIYRVVTDVKTSTGTIYESTHGPLAAVMRESFSEVEAATHIFLDYLIIKKNNEVFAEERIAYADSSLFSVFTLPLIRGDSKNILNAEGDIVLSESAARKYFGTNDPVGQTLLINGKNLAHVTGVMKDMPRNSHFRVDILVSKATLGESWMHNWKRFFFYTYILLSRNVNPDLLKAKLPGIIDKHLDQSEVKYKLDFEPLTNVYLEGKPRGSRTGTIATGSLANVYIFGVIAVFVLFIAGFNFINLTTAFSIQRAKEISLRKVLGGVRTQLVFQFLVDAVLLSMIAFAIALCLCSLLLPLFNEVAGKIIIDSIFNQSHYILLLLLLAIVIGLLSGIYPAIFLSGFEPIKGLKGNFAHTKQGLLLRRGLVITQFSISITLIISTIVVYWQLQYLQNTELGFRKDHQMVIDFQFDNRIISREGVVRQQLSGVPHVEQVNFSSSIPGKANHQFPVSIENMNGDSQEFLSDTYYVSYDFIRQYEIDLVAGRFFSKEFTSDSTEAMIINEATVKVLGFMNPQEAIGKKFSQLRREGTIVGVIRDFHFHSKREQVRPLTVLIGKSFLTFLTLDISSQNIPATVQSIESVWRQLVPDLPMIYFFSDEAYNAQYISEERFGKLFVCFATLAILISCLGLVGLSMFSIVQRTKEIGIRKVLGSSTVGIVNLLNREFFILMLMAFSIAAPLAWLCMNKWLEIFAYQIAIAWWMFALAGGIVLLVSFATISFQTLRAANANPVKSLRNE